MSLRVGIIGCGNISAAYLRLAPEFAHFEITACADLNSEAARARAAEFGIAAMEVDALLASPEIDLILNLTVPAAHFAVAERVLKAGKHLYSEKPYVLSLEEGRALAGFAEERGLRIGSAPDTFLGGAHQMARRLIDEGAVGRINSGTAFVQSPGMEMWHPNPDFFFKPGGGPILDLGPYYIANLVQLLGPVAQVVAVSSSASPTRTITSEPRAGDVIEVETPTTIHAILVFESGAQIIFAASWDVQQHGHAPMELYGATGTLHVPDPNFFGGELRLTQGESFVNPALDWHHPFSRANDGRHANYRGAGLAEMAQALAEGRHARCDGRFALHVVEVMTAILRAGETGALQSIETRCERPAPLSPAEAETLLKER
ncbi:MAG: Gfo/Idh/MocA family oxidoreductase [Pseudomonadota bacterium]